MLCMACGSRDAEADGLLCGACRAAVDGGLDGADPGAEVFNCVMQNMVAYRVRYRTRAAGGEWQDAESVILTPRRGLVRHRSSHLIRRVGHDGTVAAGEEIEARHEYPAGLDIEIVEVEAVCGVDGIAKRKRRVPEPGECTCDPAHTAGDCVCGVREL